MKYVYGDAVLPCNEKGDFNANDMYVSIVCRLYLKEPPDDVCVKIAREEDGNNFNSDCFFLESVAEKNNIAENISASDWFLYYVKEDGTFIEFGYVDDVPEDAWEYFKKQIGIEY